MTSPSKAMATGTVTDGEKLDAIRSKPMVQLTDAEIDALPKDEQRYVLSFLARPASAPWFAAPQKIAEAA